MNNSEFKTSETLDRTLGCMVGGAVGDALGYAVEFDSWPMIQHRYGPRGIRAYAPKRRGLAPISDDTQLSLFTAAGMLNALTCACVRSVAGPIEGYCKDIYIDWLHTQTCDSPAANRRGHSWLVRVPELYARRSPGNTCLSAIRALELGRKVENDSCGCGGVMRTAPIAPVVYIHGADCEDLAYVDQTAADVARMTHKHPLGFMPSAALNRILWRIMAGEVGSREDLRRVVLEASRSVREVRSPEHRMKTYGKLWPAHCDTLEAILSEALRLADTDVPDPEAIERIGGGWTGHEALAIAVFCAVRHYGSFEESVIAAVNHSGDSDSTGAVCGNIAGCLYGRRAIPARFTDALELLPVIEEMAHDLWDGCPLDEYRSVETPDDERWFQMYIKSRWPFEPERVSGAVGAPALLYGVCG